MKKENNKKRHILFILLIFSVIAPSVSALYLDDLEDVNTSTAISCNILHYDGVNWTNYDLWNQTIKWYKPHNFTNNITAKYFFGNGSFLTGITSTLPSYLTRKGHPHNQDLNTTNAVTFSTVNTGYGNNELYGMNQDVKTTSTVRFYEIGLSNQPSCRAKLSATQTLQSGSYRKVNLSSLDYDLSSNFDTHDYRFIVDTRGLYLITYSVYCLSLSDRNVLGARIYVNGNAYGGSELVHSSTSSSSDLSVSGSDVLFLYDNDYIELYAYQNSGSGKFLPNYTYSNYMTVYKLA